MNGNIDQHLKIVNTTTVLAKGWVDFDPGDPATVDVWVGVGQGVKKQPGAVYGDGWVTVDNPDPAAVVSQSVNWQANAKIRNGAGTYKPGAADGAAVAIGNVKPYPWGRQVNLTP